MRTKKEVVSDLLKKNAMGLTIVEISKLSKISRNTVAIALAELKGEDVITIRPVGKAKLHYWRGDFK
jgi:predicted transcriptional regulator